MVTRLKYTFETVIASKPSPLIAPCLESMNGKILVHASGDPLLGGDIKSGHNRYWSGTYLNYLAILKSLSEMLDEQTVP
jgi:hypothetical protein